MVFVRFAGLTSQQIDEIKVVESKCFKITSSPTTCWIWGTVIKRKVLKPLAPSIFAASYCSPGTVFRAASTFTMIRGAPNQTLIKIITGNTMRPSVKNEINSSVSPKLSNRWGTNPYTTLRIHFRKRQSRWRKSPGHYQ